MLLLVGRSEGDLVTNIFICLLLLILRLRCRDGQVMMLSSVHAESLYRLVHDVQGRQGCYNKEMSDARDTKRMAIKPSINMLRFVTVTSGMGLFS